MVKKTPKALCVIVILFNYHIDEIFIPFLQSRGQHAQSVRTVGVFVPKQEFKVKK